MRFSALLCAGLMTVGCASAPASKPAPVEQPCVRCTVYAVYHPTNEDVAISHDAIVAILSCSGQTNLFPLVIPRNQAQGIEQGMIVDIVDGAPVPRSFFPGWDSPRFINFADELRQDLATHGPYWRQLIKPLSK